MSMTIARHGDKPQPQRWGLSSYAFAPAFTNEHPMELRQDSHTQTRGRDARGRGREGVAEIIAMIEDMADRRCSVRQIVEAVRAFTTSPSMETCSPKRVSKCDDAFSQFLAAYPERPGGNARQPALDAWRAALADGADPEHLIEAAKVYAAETKGIDRRYIAAPSRWLTEGRWRAKAQTAATIAPGVWIAADSAEGRAWATFWKTTKGRTPPIDSKGGWWFASRLPPSLQAAE